MTPSAAPPPHPPPPGSGRTHICGAASLSGGRGPVHRGLNPGHCTLETHMLACQVLRLDGREPFSSATLSPTRSDQTLTRRNAFLMDPSPGLCRINTSHSEIRYSLRPGRGESCVQCHPEALFAIRSPPRLLLAWGRAGVSGPGPPRGQLSGSQAWSGASPGRPPWLPGL